MLYNNPQNENTMQQCSFKGDSWKRVECCIPYFTLFEEHMKIVGLNFQPGFRAGLLKFKTKQQATNFQPRSLSLHIHVL